MTDEVLSALRDSAKALREGRGGRKIKIGAKQIKPLRVKLNLTQEEFADRIGVSVKTVQSWEQDVNKSPGILAQAMIRALLLEARQTEPA